MMLEIQNQIEELLQQVAPEDTDHVDETILMQFLKRREDELLKTLQTMRERQLHTRLKLQQKSERPE
jgi:dsDNA-binding SOS-regulon protein